MNLKENQKQMKKMGLRGSLDNVQHQNDKIYNKYMANVKKVAGVYGISKHQISNSIVSQSLADNKSSLTLKGSDHDLQGTMPIGRNRLN